MSLVTAISVGGPWPLPWLSYKEVRFSSSGQEQAAPSKASKIRSQGEEAHAAVNCCPLGHSGKVPGPSLHLKMPSPPPKHLLLSKRDVSSCWSGSLPTRNHVVLGGKDVRTRDRIGNRNGHISSLLTTFQPQNGGKRTHRQLWHAHQVTPH